MVLAPNSRLHSRKAVAAFMSLWLSGAFFLFLCSGPAEAAVEHCPLAKASANCHHGGGASRSSFEAAKTNSPDCCAFIPVLFDKVRAGESVVHVAQAVPAKAAAGKPRVTIPVPAAVVATYIRPARSLQRSFVKNCVFRI